MSCRPVARSAPTLSLLTLSILALACLGWTSSAEAQQRQTNPAYAEVEDQAGLPRVLLLGDSISIGYTVPVREQLAGEANVHRPPQNCSSTRTGVERLDAWLGERPWDVIHFNFGLHDLKYVLGDSADLVPVDTQASHRQVPLEEYAANLQKIVQRLKETKAQLVWCTTTPVPSGARGRVPEDVAQYNAAALRIMQEHGVAVNDLNAFALPRLDKIQKPKDVHYTPEGSQVLAKQVAESIRAQLKAKAN